MERNKGNSIIKFPSDYIIIDIETTGLSLKADKIIEVAALKIKNNKIEDSYTSLINPHQEINQFIQNLTGISNDDLKRAPSADMVLSELLSFIGESILVAHNANFDINFLYDEIKENLDMEFNNDFVDTLRISRKALPSLENHKLDTIIDHYSIEKRKLHRALDDCELTYEIFKKLKESAKEEYGTIRDFTKAFKRTSKPVQRAQVATEAIEERDIEETITIFVDEVKPIGKRVNKLAYLLLAVFLGIFGVHKFYEGKIKRGLIYLCLCWTYIPFFIALYDFFKVLFIRADENGFVYL